MDAKVHDLDFVLRQREQWVIPVYQRHYEWEIGEGEQIPKFWEDLRDKAIERLEKGRIPLPHYFGAIIYSESKTEHYGAVSQKFLVDGQQRLTTFQIVLIVMREVARKFDVERLIEIIDTYLFNDENRGMKNVGKERFKLWPSVFDRGLFQKMATGDYDSLVAAYTPKHFHGNGRIIKGGTPKLLLAYNHMYGEIFSFIENYDEEPEVVLDALLDGFFKGFQIVIIQLEENDNAQEIFASLNGLGKPLDPFDLIRNSIFHRARKYGEDVEELYNSKWEMLEKPFWSDKVRQGRLKRSRADHLIAHTVVAETARDVNIGKIAIEYQRYTRDRDFSTVAEELDILIGHAKNYKLLEQAHKGSVVEGIANVLETWDLSTFHPFVLWVLSYVFDEDQQLKILELLESYLVRRELCGLTTKNYNKVNTTFIRAAKSAEKSSLNVYDAFSMHMMKMEGEASKMPTDTDVKEAILRLNVYERIPYKRLIYILQNIEYSLRDKFDETTVLTTDLTIEHIMPRRWAKNWPLSDGEKATHESSWLAMLDQSPMDDAMKALVDTRAQAVNTMGNLTLVTSSMNPSLSNDGWEKKKEKLAGSLLVLNRLVADIEHWDERSIEKRAIKIGDIIVTRWPALHP